MGGSELVTEEEEVIVAQRGYMKSISTVNVLVKANGIHREVLNFTQNII
jgi:hypothetical protein